MKISVLNGADASVYQAVRLDGLRRDPYAFGSTYDRESKFSLETVSERVQPSRGKFVLGAFGEDGSLVGIVTFMRESGIKTLHKGNVFGMYVIPEKRGMGVGRKLMEELIRRAREVEGVEQINLTVVSENHPAKQLYQSIGFQTFGLERNALKFEGQYFDEEWMVLRL
ncbi:GNAT family N-acetyltransferase [Paenibacillus ihbetae]|uniref:GNAT family N-acetyltransferase n=1 Tax=Paenibacillus ihbetae TaxID=1870820 RepID=A0ABX3JZP2_9BACL|nr:GNAT family N-acetyltransferase [Paenibacillus ihbetae]OOC62553.1 GNAT family N-acetyltransferase [Paenibacillus ihbetae]